MLAANVPAPQGFRRGSALYGMRPASVHREIAPLSGGELLCTHPHLKEAPAVHSTDTFLHTLSSTQGQVAGHLFDRSPLSLPGIDDLDAVVSTIGGTVADPTADSQGNINLIEQAVQSGVKKFVLVTSIGTGGSKDAPGEEVYNVLKPVLVEKEKAEKALMVRDAASANTANANTDQAAHMDLSICFHMHT
jgi:NAD(P)H-binding